MKLRTSVGALVAAAVVLAASVVSQADQASSEQPQAPAAKVEVGEYVDLTFLRKLKLASAAYVNPELYKKAAVTYVYDPKVFGAEASEDLARAIKNGQVWFAHTSADGKSLKISATTEIFPNSLNMAEPADLADASKKIEMWIAAPEMEGGGGGTMKLVASVDDFLGKKPSDAFVAWSTEGPVVSP